MKKIIHPANERGSNSFGWLNSKHSFSFGHYHDPQKMGFGLLRVLNDDQVQPAMGFATHGHANMEIVSIPLSGSLKHKDSTGREEIIKTGEVQIMSAGSGIQHSEFNASKEEVVEFLQIWVFPDKENLAPGYQQKSFADALKPNELLTIVSPEGAGAAVKINQQAWFSLADLDPDIELNYNLHQKQNALYVFVIEGAIKIAETQLNRRDALGLEDVNAVTLNATEKAKVLLIEVPMQ
ncbi:pirin family protein [Pelobium manganitolerans]|uniref:pirin family protein n=1 Tax=Pelobium manganitolerans TaxID=1842495 RepID=UPI003FA3CC5C